MTNKVTVASIITWHTDPTMSAQYMTKTQNLHQFSLKCRPIHPGIHKDPSIAHSDLGLPTYDLLMDAGVIVS